MVADICISLSRMKEDKVLGTGRFHIMKNRFGQDGMTYNIKMNTNNGHIEIEGKTDLDELIQNENQPNFNLAPDKMAELFGKT